MDKDLSAEESKIKNEVKIVNRGKLRKNARMMLFFLCIQFMVLTKNSWAFEYEREYEKKFEFTVGLSLNVPFLESSYNHQYSLLLGNGQGTGTAGQVLNLNGNKNSGICFALNYFPWKNFGIQLLADSFESTFDGKNSSYDIFLEYTSRQPPDYVPRQFKYERSLEWPESVGNLRQLTFSINGIYRFRASNCMVVGFSGGLSYFHFQGEASSLGYSTFWLGGHSVLFIENYRLKFSLEPAHEIGFNTGLEMNMCIYGNLIFSVDYRYFYCPQTSSKIRLKEIINADEVIKKLTIDQIEENMNLGSVKIGPSFAGIRFGLKYKF